MLSQLLVQGLLVQKMMFVFAKRMSGLFIRHTLEMRTEIERTRVSVSTFQRDQ